MEILASMGSLFGAGGGAAAAGTSAGAAGALPGGILAQKEINMQHLSGSSIPDATANVAGPQGPNLMQQLSSFGNLLGQGNDKQPAQKLHPMSLSKPGQQTGIQQVDLMSLLNHLRGQ